MMTILTMATLFYIMVSADRDESTDFDHKENIFEDEDYLYFLTDAEIASVIQEARESIRLTDPYQLSPDQPETKLDEIAFVYVETPELTAKLEARRILDHFGRTPSVPEIKKLLSDRYLPVNTRFYDNYAYVFDVTAFQQSGEETEEVRIQEVNQSSGSLKQVWIDMEDVETNLPLQIRLEDTADPTIQETYTLHFQDYVHE